MIEMKGYSDVLRTVEVVDCRVKQAWMRSPLLPTKQCHLDCVLTEYIFKYILVIGTFIWREIGLIHCLQAPVMDNTLLLLF